MNKERGRPCEYEREFAEEAKELCAAGYTNAEIAKFFGVADSTIYLWKKRFPEFNDALKDWKEAADRRVEDCLFHRATGYKHKVVKPFIDQKSGVIKYAEHEESLPPDATSMIFWLKNRKRDEWRDRHDSETTIKGDADDGNSLAKLANSIAALADKLAGGDDKPD